MHANYYYVENRKQLNKTHKRKINRRYNLGNPFQRKPNWKTMPLCSFSLNGK